MMYVFTFHNDEELKKWGKSIVYNKDLAKAEFKPTEFENFIACTKDQVFDEIFELEDQDYTYASIKIMVEQKRIERAKNKENKKQGMDNGLFDGCVCRSDSELEDDIDDQSLADTNITKYSIFSKQGFKELVDKGKAK